MSENCSHDCASCGEDCAQKGIIKEKQNEKSRIKKVIGVISGKGGVGKSLVTSLLAVAAKRAGNNVAVLDADITGPSIPKLFGITEKAYSPDGKFIMPAQSKKGVKIMSVNLLLENDSDPVVWRGPIIAGTVKQFWTEVCWGDVDFMFVDMPPGTGDVALTVFQSLPVDGIVIVTSPQELVSMIVEKAVKMAGMMKVPILGVVENMSYYVCPNCGDKIRIFGKGNLKEISEKYGIPVSAEIPINPEIAKACDRGEVEEIKGDWLNNMYENIKDK